MDQKLIHTEKESPLYHLQLTIERADVCLVTMPYSLSPIPSLALGLLQSSLVEAGFKARSIYANLLFCEQLGLNKYRLFEGNATNIPLAAWSFSSISFPDFYPAENEFIQITYSILGPKLKISLDKYREELFLVREQAEHFTSALAKQILEMSPRIVGCSSSFSQRIPSLALLRKIHELNPEVITIMGGAECETVMGRATHQHFTWVDYVMSGEGEDSIVPLVRQIFEVGRKISCEILTKRK